MINTTKKTTVKDAARHFWGKTQFEYATNNKLEKVESDICMLSDSYATNGSLMIYGAGELEFNPVKNSRYCDVPREQIKPVIMPYISASVCAKVPDVLFGHLAAGHSKKIYLAAAGRWCSFVAYDPDHGMRIEDGADMGDFFNLGGIKATFDGSEIAKIFKKFKVEGVEICRPSKGSDFMRFYVTFKGAKFTAILLKCYRDDYNADFEDEAAALVTEWDAQDVSVAPAPVEAVATYPAAPVAACEASKAEDSDDSAENAKNDGVRIEKNAEFGSVEIYFKEKPSMAVRDALKTAHFRWHAVKKCWYGYADADTVRHMIEAAEGIEAINAENFDAEGKKAHEGVDVPPEAKKAPEAKETAKSKAVPEPVEGKRDFLRDIRKGDVVRISGIKGTTGKSINGLYYVETVHGAGDYWLNSLKRDRGSDMEGIGKKSHSWPLHCYANNPKVRAEFRENIKDAKIEGMGPRSAAVYSLMLRGLNDLRANMGKCGYWGKFHQEEMQKRADELEAELCRMCDENPGLDRFAAKLDEKFKPTGPGLAIRADGLEVRGDCGTWDKYNLTLRHEGDRVFISGGYYGRRSSTIPAGFGFDVTNNSDSMTDYFEADNATVKQDHPLFDTLVRIIDAGRGRYELTDEDAGEIEAYLAAKKAKEVEAREAERAEYIEKCKKQEQHAREVIDEYIELFPGDAYHPHIIVEWSELGAMNDRGRERGDSTIFSVEAFEAITGELDSYFKDDKGYYKLKFEFVDPVHGDHHFVDRCDIGEGTGSYGSRARMVIKWCKEHPNQEYMRDGGATCTPAEGTTDAYYYLENIPATFDEINAA